MKRLDRYIARHIVLATAVAWLLVTALDALFSFFGEIGDVGRGHYGLAQALAYIALSLPQRAYDLFPVSVLLGALMGLGALAAQGELTAIRLAGFSRGRLIRSVLQSGLLLLVLVVGVGETVAPLAERQAQQLRALAIFERVAFAGAQGLWVRDGPRFINVRGVDAGGRMVDVRIFALSADRRLLNAVQASRADYVDHGWRLSGLRESRFGLRQVRTYAAAAEVRDIAITPALLGVLALQPQTLSLAELRRYIRYRVDNGLEAERYRLAFWVRLATPVSALVMLALALGFVLGALGHAGTGRRLFVGILIGLVFRLLNDLLAQAGLVYGMAPALSAFLPTLAFAAAAAWLYRARPAF